MQATEQNYKLICPRCDSETLVDENIFWVMGEEIVGRREAIQDETCGKCLSTIIWHRIRVFVLDYLVAQFFATVGYASYVYIEQGQILEPAVISDETRLMLLKIILPYVLIITLIRLVVWGSKELWEAGWIQGFFQFGKERK